MLTNLKKAPSCLIRRARARVANSILFLRYIRNKAKRSWVLRHRDRLMPFRNHYSGRDCFIVGNGPSLNQMDLSLLNEYHSFGLNKIFLLFDRSDFRPDFLVSVNKYVIRQSREYFENLDIPMFLSYRGSEDWRPKNKRIHFIFGEGGDLRFDSHPLYGTYEGWTVTYVALQLAYYMGFENVFLVGVDHNFKAQGAPNELQKMEGADPNHFDPRYFQGHEWQLPDLAGSEMAYSMARFSFERRGRKIYDATIGGKCQVFPKISFEEALQMARKKEEYGEDSGIAAHE